MVDEGQIAVEVIQRRVGRLRQSILKWAFEGKLVDQDPADEPASVLLDRIRAERAAAKAPVAATTTQRRRTTTSKTPRKAAR